MVGGSDYIAKITWKKWFGLFSSMRPELENMYLFWIYSVSTCYSRSWTRAIFHASMNHWEPVLLTAHSTDLSWYLTRSTQQIKLETMSHKESKERIEKLLICRWIKFHLPWWNLNTLKNVTNYTETSLFKIGHSH